MTGEKNLEWVDEVIQELEQVLEKLRQRRTEQEARDARE